MTSSVGHVMLQDKFWTNARAKQLYKNHLRTMYNRVNSFNNIQYKNDWVSPHGFPLCMWLWVTSQHGPAGGFGERGYGQPRVLF